MKFKYLLLAFFAGVLAFGAVSFIFTNSSAEAGSEAASEKTVINKSYKTVSIPENTKIIVYYFHGNMRCTSCKLIERYTKESVKTKYADEIKKGLVELRAVNVEKGNNSHFIKDYQLVSRSVVVSRVENGEEKEWKRLDKVWRLLNNEAKFYEYIYTNIESLIKGKA
jgi:ABC-type Fe3+-hydroxamate transport system substrate-binding protein